MPKNGKRNYPPIRPVPPATPRPPEPNGDGFGGVAWVDIVPTEPLLLKLAHLNAVIMPTLQKGDQVILQIDSLPIVVTTVLGVPIGQVGIDDVEAVRGRQARKGFIFSVQSNPLSCIVEVR